MDALAAAPVSTGWLALDLMAKQLGSQDRNAPGRLDTQTHVIAFNPDDRDRNIRPNHDLLRQLPTQDQHSHLPAEPD
jgi:hypothetical protein